MSEYTKPCNTCKAEIRMSNNTGKWLPYNLDGSAHSCRSQNGTNKNTGGNLPPVSETKNEKKSHEFTLEGLAARIEILEAAVEALTN